MARRRLVLPLLVSCAVCLPAAAAEGGGNALITPKFGLIIWTTVTFVVLALLLGRFAWKPLLGAIEEREKESGRASSSRAEIGRRRRRSWSSTASSRGNPAERTEAVAAGQRDADRLKAEILEEARKQRDLLLKQTDSQVQAMVRQARGELRGVAVDLAIQAAAKLLARNLDDAAQRRLVEEYLADLEKLPAGPSAGA